MRTEEANINTGNKRIAVAMSGGVDSSVTAAILVNQGYDVVGLTMQLYDHGAATSKAKACCAGQDIYDARRVADALDIPHYVLDYEAQFERDVIVPFSHSYLRGETPVPCILCNQTVKFRDLIKAAKGIGASALATGHYIKRSTGPNGAKLERALDRDRDQSYFLFSTTRESLIYLRFPLGDCTKEYTRELATYYGLRVADKPDSQDICFVPTGKYSEIVRKIGGGGKKEGSFEHVDGRNLGYHAGIENYTVGQRRGLGLGGEIEPLYVVSIDPYSKKVFVGPKSSLRKDYVVLRDVNWIGPGNSIPQEGLSITARIRNNHQPVAALVRPGDAIGTAKVEFDEALFGVSPGQACVFYQGDWVLGGGWIVNEDPMSFLPHNKRQEALRALS
ncbi:MAG: tRNA 2-thiouridine(34) synthase MnmA [Rhodospirillaceae bacterium]